MSVTVTLAERPIAIDQDLTRKNLAVTDLVTIQKVGTVLETGEIPLR